ncbi:MAG: recombinase family protein [Bacillota bacterium]|nr:recombinase family protein [Bacillota bacterium]
MENKKAVLYCCVSGSLDGEGSLEGYKERMATRAESSGYHITHFYIDDCSSSTIPLYERTAFSHMLMDAKAGKIAQIVILNANSFSRNIDETIAVTRELKEYGAKVYAILENTEIDVDNNPKFAMIASLAQTESNKISERIERAAAARKAKRQSSR